MVDENAQGAPDVVPALQLLIPVWLLPDGWTPDRVQPEMLEVLEWLKSRGHSQSSGVRVVLLLIWFVHQVAAMDSTGVDGDLEECLRALLGDMYAAREANAQRYVTLTCAACGGEIRTTAANAERTRGKIITHRTCPR